MTYLDFNRPMQPNWFKDNHRKLSTIMSWIESRNADENDRLCEWDIYKKYKGDVVYEIAKLIVKSSTEDQAIDYVIEYLMKNKLTFPGILLDVGGCIKILEFTLNLYRENGITRLTVGNTGLRELEIPILLNTENMLTIGNIIYIFLIDHTGTFSQI